MKLPQHLLTIDFETYWSDDFTLKKLSIEEYVRDPRFLVHGAAVKYGDHPSRWIKARDLPAFFLNVPWEQVAVLCQNAPFDALILTHHYNVKPAMWLCTLAMARMMLPRSRHNLATLSRLAGLPPKGNAVLLTKNMRELPPLIEEQLAAYATGGNGETEGGDADNTYSVFRWLLAMGFPHSELEIVDTTVRMFAEPKLTLDVPRARKLLANVTRSKRSALRRLGVTKEQVSSTPQFAEILLERFGIECETKPGKRGPIPALAKNDQFLKSLLEHENPDVQALAAVRLAVKSTLEETRLRRLLAMNKRGLLCVYLNFAGAHTLRWSGGDKMNWQNFPRGSELRKCIKALKGFVIAVADLSQIEARVLNCLAEQWDILALFESGDPYSVLAAKFFGRPVDRKKNPEDKPLGQVGKVGELGLGYGMGPPKLKATLRQGAMGAPPMIIDDATAKKWVYEDYRGSHQNVVKLWEQGERALQLLFDRAENYPWGPMVIHQGYIFLPNGTRLDYTGLVREEGEWLMRDRNGDLMRNSFGNAIRLYGAMFIENIVQALARAIVVGAMPAIRERYPIVMLTHDDIAVVAPASEAYKKLNPKTGKEEDHHPAVDFMIETMTRRPSWMPRIPLAAEGGFDECYSK